MIYPIYVYGSKVLREVAVDITDGYPNLGDLLSSMFYTMYSSEGVGLAAPQIGESIRVFTIGLPLEVADGEPPKMLEKVFINPQIYSYSDSVCTSPEGCLSLPGLSSDVVRPTTIKIRYCDENFVEHDDTFTGFFARVIQHEYDHLEGIVYTDRVSSELKVSLESDLSSMLKGDFSSEYKTIQDLDDLP